MRLRIAFSILAFVILAVVVMLAGSNQSKFSPLSRREPLSPSDQRITTTELSPLDEAHAAQIQAERIPIGVPEPIDKERSLVGVVRDETGRVVPGCEVVLRDGPGGARVTADSQGRFRFDSVTSDEVWLFVSNSACRDRVSTLNTHEIATEEKPGWGASRYEFDSEDPGTITLTILRAAFIEGRVVDSSGMPLEGALVRSEHEAGVHALIGTPDRTEETGRFSLRVLPGRSDLIATASAGPNGQDKANAGLKGLEIQPGERRNIGDLSMEIKLGKLTISGRIVDPKGKGREDIRVELRNAVGLTLGSVDTNFFGSFRFRDVQPGDYEVIVAPDSVIRATRSVSLTRLKGSVSLEKITLQEEW